MSLTAPTVQEEDFAPSIGSDSLERRAGGRWRDYFALGKPLITGLLLATTWAGMVVAGGRLPPTSLAFWTLLGGGMTAAGASALNQFIDRDLDARMSRTRRRPLPGGRLSPRQALRFGLVLIIGGICVLAVRVNVLSAFLAALGAATYIGAYSLYLKRATPQNIVIGGSAGAIPPLVGWAAATGSLAMPALFLFAVVFFWTPPHFWALSLTRRNEYADAEIPMLPVVYGDPAARWHILLYSIQLVALTLLLPGIGMAGTLFLASALGLGAIFVYHAWSLWRAGGRRRAWMLYRYSSVYLALIFGAMVVDILVRQA